jgi:YggT family protein
MNALATLIDTVVTVYVWVLIASAVLSWLIAFNIINTHNRVIYTVVSILHRLTEPVLRPIRRILPTLGGVDLSPSILILVLYFLRNLIVDNLRG